MRQRQDITELFSTFLSFEAERASDWVTDLRLRRNIQSHLNTLSEAQISDRFLATYWHHCWQQEAQKSVQTPIALNSLGHLSAYLQETCYWSAYNITRQTQEMIHKLSDCFQVAIAEVPKVLQSKDPLHPSSLKTYASLAFSNIIKDFLRQRRELDLCSDWGLLLKLSRKRLKEALTAAGMDNGMIDQRILAWSCFETTYLPTKKPGLRTLAAPDRSTWEAIATLYNRQRQQLSSPGEDCSPDTLEKWLKQCVKDTRAYFYPAISSLNRPKSEDDAGELQDSLVDQNRTNLINDWITKEEVADRQAQYQQLHAVLTDAVKALDPLLQQLLSQYYERQLTQQQIVQELDIPQYTVSRKLAKAREKLLLALIQWCQNTLHIVPDSNVVKDIATILDEWLIVNLKTS